VTGTAGWAIALIVLLIVRSALPADGQWWIWTCAAGVAMGLFALWYVPRFKRARARSAARRARDRQAQQDSELPTMPDSDQPAQQDGDQPAMRDSDQPAMRDSDQSAPRDNGSKTVSSTETPGKSTKS